MGGKDNENTHDTDTAVHKMAWNLDTRVRHIEGMIPSFFLLETDTIIVPHMIAGNTKYDSQLKKGQPHPHGPRRTSLAAAFLNAISVAELDKAVGEVEIQRDFYDSVAELAKIPKMAEQQILLKKLLTSYDTAKKMEPEITQCLFFKTKKPDPDSKANRYYFSIAFSPFSPLRHTAEFVRLCIMSSNAMVLDGPPPLGTIMRDIPRHR